MVGAIVLLLVGAVVLTIGAEGAIRGAARFARGLGVPMFVLGALLFGLDLESLGAAMVAAGQGETSIAAGTEFGTIVFLLSVAFGVALLASPRPVASPSRQMVLAPMMGLAGGALALADQLVTRFEAIALIGIYVVYVSQVVREGSAVRARAEAVEHEADEILGGPPLLLLALGLVMVYVGAALMVRGGTGLLERTGLSAGFVGAAVVGTLASLDEVLLEVLPVIRGVPALATGNLFGTVSAYSSGALGLAALVRPLSIDSAASVAFLAATVLYAIVATVFLARGQAGKLVGVAVLCLYVLWFLIAFRV